MPNSWNKNKHHFGIVSSSSGTVGLMLAQRDHKPQWSESDDPFLAPQFYSDIPGYDYLPPEKEFAIVQESHHAGFGQQYYDRNDPFRYAESYGMDLRHKNMAIAGPKATAVTKPSVLEPPLVNGNMETDGGAPAGWSAGARDSGQAHGGTYSCKLVLATGAMAVTYITQALSVTIGDYQGRYVSVGGWCYLDADINGFNMKIGIEDGQGTTWSTERATQDSWLYHAVTRQIHGSATGITIYLQATAIDSGDASSYMYWDDIGLGQGGISKADVKFNSKHYKSFGNVLAKRTADNFTELYAFPASITALKTFTDNKLYIACGLENSYWEMDTAEAFTVNSNANATIKHFLNVYGTVSTMWATLTANTLISTADPSDTGGGFATSGTTTVDIPDYVITGLVTDENIVYIPKEDRMFYLDTSGNVKVLIEETKVLSTTDQGKNSYTWKHKVYYPCGEQSLVEYDGDTGENEFIEPSLYCTGGTAFVGKIQAVAGDDRYVYAAVDNDTFIEIMATRKEVIDGTTQRVWHPLCELTLDGCETLHVSNVHKKRLWITSTSTSDSIYYMPLTTKYGDITRDTDYAFEDGVDLVTPWLHANFPGDTKAFIKITLTMEDTSTNEYFEVHYQKKGDTSWTQINATDKFKVSPTTSGYIPVDASGDNPVSTYIRFKFVAKTGSASLTPKLVKYDVRGILYPTKRRVISATVLCADDLKDKDGLPLGLDAEDIETILKEADDATWPVTIYNRRGTSKTVRFLPMGSIPLRDEKDRNPEDEWRIRMQEVATS